MDASYWRELVRPIVAGRKIVITGVPVRGAGAQVQTLRDLGAAAVFVLGEGEGTGADPDFPHHRLDIGGDSMMAILRGGQAALRTPPADAVAALDAFDPQREALVIGSFLNEVSAVAGRACLAYRPPEWLALEDKLVADDVFAAAGISRAPSRTVAVGDLGWSGADEVWAGDAREGFHGGATHTHWVKNADDADAIAADLTAHCDAARVMPFLEGIPCSIHGIVVGRSVVALRPVEMMTFRRETRPYFFYAGAATYWDPSDADREAMRDLARRVGVELRRRAGFRGAFTVDGVMTEDGFLPTEINPRMGAGLTVIERAVPEIPIHFLVSAISGGVDADYQPDALETLLLERADASRGGGTWRAVTDRVAVTDQPVPLSWAGQWRRAGDEAADAWYVAGASEMGGFMRLTFHAARTPAGPSVGERAVAFYAFADRELGTSIGPLTAAPDVRRA